MHFADIDETQTTPIESKEHILEYDRRYGSLFQVVSGLSHKGFMYVGVEMSMASGDVWIGLWNFE